MYGKGLRALSLATFAASTRHARAGLLLRAARRRSGLRPEDLLPARAAGDRDAVRVRRGAAVGDPTCARATARWDLRSYVVIHIALIFNIRGLLITGSIWAKASWGHWWVWNEPTLVSFLIVFLLFATYQPLRFSIEDPERQARYASVFAIMAGAFVPLNFVAGALPPRRSCTRACSPRRGGLPGSMAFMFLVCARRDRAAVRDARAVRDRREADAEAARTRGGCSASDGGRPAAAAQRRRSPPIRAATTGRGRRLRAAQPRGGRVVTDAGRHARAAAERGRQVRRRRVRRVRRRDR